MAMTSSRSLDDLLPSVRAKAIALRDACEACGIELRFTSTYRDFAYQGVLYEQGRTAKGPNARAAKPMGDIVTRARPGESWHNWRRAFDVVPMRDGKCVWSDPVLWQRIGSIGKLNGLEWGGDFQSIKDLPHFQFTEGESLRALITLHPKGLPNA
jgi:peptidoglycan L-alanyl-D-glutamate endopeptidase CwlK